MRNVRKQLHTTIVGASHIAKAQVSTVLLRDGDPLFACQHVNSFRLYVLLLVDGYGTQLLVEKYYSVA